MSSTSIITIIIIILSVVLVDIFCGDVTNNQDFGKSTTPGPSLGRRWTVNPNINKNSRQTSIAPRKWIQQNNIWIRNEQEASGGVQPNAAPQNSYNNRQGIRGSPQKSSTSPQNNLHQSLAPQNSNINNNRQSGRQPNLASNNTPVSSSNNAEPPVSPTTTSNKSLSRTSVAVVPKNPTVSPPVGPFPSSAGGEKKDTSHSTGPTKQSEDLDGGNQSQAGDDSGATDSELRDFSEMLLRKDTNNAMKHVTVNWQGMTSSRSENDEAPLPLLSIDSAAYKIPSIEKLMLLYNNYFLDAGQNEVYTGQERIEENNLLDTVLATPAMQYARSFLIQKGKLGKDPKEFKDLLRLIWFNMYSRGGGRIGSSGFEHVFVAEIKNNQVSGLHNWLYFHEEESQNRANYLGYLKKIDLGEKGAIVKYHFTFHDIDKPVGSMFIGTSPELEMALYTTCFVLRADKICPLKMNGNKFIIRTYTYRYRGKNMIGSAFPEI